MAILVCGGAGYIGSHMTALLCEKGEEAVVVDNLQKGHRDAVDPSVPFHKADLRDEAALSKLMYSPALPDPDLLIRTSGEMRISNFLLWQTAYSEFYVTETLWPDFREKEFMDALLEYQRRERRRGK